MSRSATAPSYHGSCSPQFAEHTCCSLQVWDTNTIQAACTFPFGARVSAVGMSPVASAHCLVAVAGAQPQIKLCDPASGSFTHVLGGHDGSHREDVWTLHWSLQNEWHLLTGGCDGQVCKAPALGIHVLDNNQLHKSSNQVLALPDLPSCACNLEFLPQACPCAILRLIAFTCGRSDKPPVG